MRMAEWAQSIFATLRESLMSEAAPVTAVPMAMATMLVALEIMCPGAFGPGLSWRKHVSHARRLLLKSGEHSAEKMSNGIDGETFSLVRSWLGYVHVMGNLMAGPRSDMHSDPEFHEVLNPLDLDQQTEASHVACCITGMSAKGMQLLGRVASLARQCQAERFGIDGRLRQEWSPGAARLQQAALLRQEVQENLCHPWWPCSHVSAKTLHLRDLAEMAAVNEAFHWAGLIHLYRRVMGKKRGHPDVRAAMLKIMECLRQLRVGAASEMRFLFPLFTAGCEATDDGIKSRLVDRLVSAGRRGMKHVSPNSSAPGFLFCPLYQAQPFLQGVILLTSLAQVHLTRMLLEKVWTSGCSWEEIIRDEFVA